jgi:hypothetical protein
VTLKNISALEWNRKRCGWGQPWFGRRATILFLAFVLLPLVLCSCAHNSPPAASQSSGEEFVYIASVHSQPVENEPKPNAWLHVYGLLDQRGIRVLMTSSGGVASISVERDRSHEAVELLRGDAARRGYWIQISKEF